MFVMRSKHDENKGQRVVDDSFEQNDLKGLASLPDFLVPGKLMKVYVGQ